MPGNPNGYTTNAYTPIGNLSTGWTEYKLTFNFSNDTYTVSTRTDSACAWVPMKAAAATGYDIPMRGTADNTDNTALHLPRGRRVAGTELGLDDVRYSATPIPDGDGDMPVTPVDCDSCHASDDHGDGPYCGSCHGCPKATPARRLQIHIPADVTNCTPCHDASLTIEHNGRTPDAGGTVRLQHVPRPAPTRSSRPPSPRTTRRARRVTRARVHTALHDSTVGSTPLGTTGQVCGDCHDANVQTEHSKASSSSAAAGCANCHPVAEGHADARRGSRAASRAAVTHPARRLNSTAAWTRATPRSPARPATWPVATRRPATDGLDVTHLGASAVLGGQTRTSCMVCHWNGIPTTGECATCHADKVDGTHGGVNAHPFTAGSDAVASGDAGCTNSGSGCHGTDPARGNFSDLPPEDRLHERRLPHLAEQTGLRGQR